MCFVLLRKDIVLIFRFIDRDINDLIVLIKCGYY